MILEDGKHYDRGTVLDIDRLPDHLRKEEYIAQGAVSINTVMPVDIIELDDVQLEDELEQKPSPMKELELPDLQPKLVKRKVLKR